MLLFRAPGSASGEGVGRRLTALTCRERTAGVEGTTGYIWCRKTPACSDGVRRPSRAINAPNGCSNMVDGLHLDPSCLADGARAGSPHHLSDSHKQEFPPVQNKYWESRKSNFGGRKLFMRRVARAQNGLHPTK